MNFFYSRNKIFHNLCILWIKVNKGWTKNWINIMNYSETYEKDISSKLAIMTTVFSFISICAYCRKDWSVYIRYNYNGCKQSFFPVKWLFMLSLVVFYSRTICVTIKYEDVWFTTQKFWFFYRTRSGIWRDSKLAALLV